VKLSHGLVLTSWGAHPNCNLVLSCTGSPMHLLRQKLQDEKRTRQNEWRITQGTQPERRVLPLESRSNNKSNSSSKSIASLRLAEQEHFLVCFASLLDFPKLCMHIVHSPLGVLLGSRLSSSHVAVVSWVLSYIHFALIVPLYQQILPNIHHGVRKPSSHVIMISSCLHVSILFGYPRECHHRSHWGLI
jgi:hypothetical protein